MREQFAGKDLRNARKRFSAAMEGAKSVIDQVPVLPGEEFLNLLYYLLCDGYRTTVSIEVLVQQGLSDPDLGIPAESVEVLGRQILERTVFSSYTRKHPARIVDRMLKTSACQWKRSWKESADKAAEELKVQILPHTAQMARELGGDLGEAWKRLSYLSHPRGGRSYSLVELARGLDRGLSSEEFFSRRVQRILPWLADWLTMLTSNFSDAQESQ